VELNLREERDLETSMPDCDYTGNQIWHVFWPGRSFRHKI